MNERLTDEQIEGLRQDSIYERMIVGSDVRMLILDLRHYKKLAEERGKALEWYANESEEAARQFHFGAVKSEIGQLARQALQEGDTP